MNYYLCIEHGEKFVLKATSEDKAKKVASMYGGEVIRALTDKELAKSDPERGIFNLKN